MKAYQDFYSKWQTEPVEFWREAAKEINWSTPPKRGFVSGEGVYGRWFPDAMGNTCLLYTSPSPRDS